MRRPLVLLGALALGSGTAMYILLGQLKSDFFRAYLPPWTLASEGLAAAGGVVLLTGLLARPSVPALVTGQGAARLTAKLAMANGVAAAAFVAPVLDPALRLPFLITQWPGIYMVIAYVSFVVVGVLGMAAWSLILLNSKALFGSDSFSKAGVAVQLLLTEAGAYALAVSMFLGGYVGSWLAYTGAGAVVVGAQMEFSVIPSAVSIFAVAAGTVVGVVNVLMTGRSVPS